MLKEEIVEFRILGMANFINCRNAKTVILQIGLACVESHFGSVLGRSGLYKQLQGASLVTSPFRVYH